MNKMYEYNGTLYNMDKFYAFKKGDVLCDNPYYMVRACKVGRNGTRCTDYVVFKFNTKKERDTFYDWLKSM